MSIKKYDKTICLARLRDGDNRGVETPWQEAVVYRDYFADGENAVRIIGQINFERAHKYDLKGFRTEEEK